MPYSAAALAAAVASNEANENNNNSSRNNKGEDGEEEVKEGVASGKISKTVEQLAEEEECDDDMDRLQMKHNL
jgi:hypothetical protein